MRNVVKVLVLVIVVLSIAFLVQSKSGSCATMVEYGVPGGPLGDVAARVATLEGQVTTLQAQVATLQNQMTSQQGQIAAL
jgi:peptidoglycan hydrolase CwlO-like protein